MATVYAEHNQAKWIGVRPGIEGEQIVKDARAVAVDTLLYTVPANKILLLFTNWIGMRGMTAAGWTELIVRNNLAARQYAIGIASASTSVSYILTSYVSRYIPLEVPATWDIYLDIVAGTPVPSAAIEGILIDA